MAREANQDNEAFRLHTGETELILEDDEADACKRIHAAKSWTTSLEVKLSFINGEWGDCTSHILLKAHF